MGPLAITTIYQCDALNRLVSSRDSVGGGAGLLTTYAYDLNGNQVSQDIPGLAPLTMQWDTHDRLVGGNVMGVTGMHPIRVDS